MYNYRMGFRRALERIRNRVPPGAVRGDNESFFGIPFHALFGKTLDTWQDSGNEPVEWWSHVEEIFEFYNEQLKEAGNMVRNQNYDYEIWQAIYQKAEPEEIVQKHYGKGGINALKTTHRIRPGELWRKHEAVLRDDEAPVMMLVDGYGTPESRISMGAWQGNTPLVLITDELMQGALFDTSFVESLNHHPDEKLGFRITPGKKSEVWDENNLSTMSARDPVASERLGLIADRHPDYRRSQLIEVCEIAKVANESPNLFRQICGLATLGKTRGGVGIAATMSPAEAIAWSEKGTKLQKEFLNQARFVVGTVLDADTATHLGKTLAPRVEMTPEDLAEKLLFAGGSQVVFVDDGVVEMGWLIG